MFERIGIVGQVGTLTPIEGLVEALGALQEVPDVAGASPPPTPSGQQVVQERIHFDLGNIQRLISMEPDGPASVGSSNTSSFSASDSFFIIPTFSQ